jgi:hypothetical protein
VIVGGRGDGEHHLVFADGQESTPSVGVYTPPLVRFVRVGNVCNSGTRADGTPSVFEGMSGHVGPIAEVIFSTDGHLDPAVETQVVAYLDAKYGLSTQPAPPLQIYYINRDSFYAPAGPQAFSAFGTGITPTTEFWIHDEAAGLPPAPGAQVTYQNESKIVMTYDFLEGGGDAVFWLEDAGQRSNEIRIPVTEPEPSVITSLDPSSVPVGYTDYLTVYGSGFTPSSVISVNGQIDPTTFLGSTRIMQYIEGVKETAVAGTFPVVVHNDSAPGSPGIDLISNVLYLEVTP